MLSCLPVALFSLSIKVLLVLYNPAKGVSVLGSTLLPWAPEAQVATASQPVLQVRRGMAQSSWMEGRMDEDAWVGGWWTGQALGLV